MDRLLTRLPQFAPVQSWFGTDTYLQPESFKPIYTSPSHNVSPAKLFCLVLHFLLIYRLSMMHLLLAFPRLLVGVICGSLITNPSIAVASSSRSLQSNAPLSSSALPEGTSVDVSPLTLAFHLTLKHFYLQTLLPQQTSKQ